MASVKIKFRPSTIEGKEGTVYYQIIQNRVIRQLKTDYRIFTDEWNEAESCIIAKLEAVSLSVVRNEAICSFPCRNAWSGT